MKRKPILCLDFDGVIHSYTSGWKGADTIPDDPVPGAIEFLEEAIDYFEVHIYSSRSHQEGGIEAMSAWIRMWAMIFHRTIGDPEFVNKLKFPKEKPPALVTIDDRAIQFTGIWPDMKELLEFKPWNK